MDICGAGLASSAVDSYAVGNSVDAVQSGTIIRPLACIYFLPAYFTSFLSCEVDEECALSSVPIMCAFEYYSQLLFA